MSTRVKREKHTSTEKNSDARTKRISVNVPEGVKKRFISKLAEEGKDQRSQSPTIVGWIKEYVQGEREAPKAAPASLDPRVAKTVRQLRKQIDELLDLGGN